MTIVYFVRHAEPDHSWSTDRTRPLSSEGMKDREQVLNFFKKREVDLFFSSPYERSLKTIEPTATHFGKHIITDERLKERVSGVDSMKSSNLERRWSDLDFSEESGESIRSVQQRNIEVLAEILKASPNKAIVVGTHGTALSCIVNFFNPEFRLANFLRIINFMPYILKMNFDNSLFIDMEELYYMKKTYQF